VAAQASAEAIYGFKVWLPVKLWKVGKSMVQKSDRDNLIFIQGNIAHLRFAEFSRLTAWSK